MPMAWLLPCLTSLLVLVCFVAAAVEQISNQNCIELLQLADQYNLDSLRNGCLDFLTDALQVRDQCVP